jgi:hypothetical protein
MIKKTKPERHLVLNRIQTPDGTILTSYHVHDMETHVDKNGFNYMVDGGSNYHRCSVNKTAPHKNLCVYSDAPYKVLRESIHRGGRGKDGTEPLKWVPISQMSNSWLEACIVYNADREMDSSYSSTMYKKELKYRRLKDIIIAD